MIHVLLYIYAFKKKGLRLSALEFDCGILLASKHQISIQIFKIYKTQYSVCKTPSKRLTKTNRRVLNITNKRDINI